MKLVWHETTHYLEYAIPESVEQYRTMTPELNWEFSEEHGTYVSHAPGRAEDYEVSSGAVLPEMFRPWLLERLGRG